jgi:tetratricopeptide (TPR) repeat protein
VNCGLRIADCGLDFGLKVALLTLVLSTSALAQSRPPGDDEARPAPFGASDLVEKGSDLDEALRAGKWERAEQLLVKKIEAAPQSAELLKLLAQVFLADRRPLNAAIAIKKAEAIAPLDSQTRYQLAIAYLAMNHGDWARPELERLAQADQTNPLYHYWLGRLDYDAGQYASAAKRFEGIVEADDTFMKAFDNLGLCYEALNKPDEAIAAYRKAIALNRQSKSPSYWPPLNLGTLLRNRGELAEAETLLREAVKYDASAAKAHYQLGALLEQQDHLDHAVVAFKHAAASDPTYADPHYALARIYRRQGKVEAATQALATFQRLHDAKRETKPLVPGGAEAPPPQ